MKKNTQSLKNAGFVLLELLVVAGIMAFFASFVLWKYNAGNRQYLLELSAQKVVNDLRRAQNMALASQDFNGKLPAGGFGIHFETANDSYDYVLFADVDEDGACGLGEEMEKINLDAEVKIASLSSNPLNVVFTLPQPAVKITDEKSDGVIKIQIKSGGPTKTIMVFDSGLIEL